MVRRSAWGIPVASLNVTSPPGLRGGPYVRGLKCHPAGRNRRPLLRIRVDAVLSPDRSPGQENGRSRTGHVNVV